MLSTTETEIQTVVMQTSEAESADEAMGSIDDLTTLEDDGDADLIAAGCKLCDESCTQDSQASITKEIEKQKTVVKKKYNKLKSRNKQKKTSAHNKRVAADNAATQAQKAKDPAEKKKLKK